MSLRADTSSHLRTDIDSALQLAGWTLVSSLTDGLVYSLTSPDGLGAHCRVQDTGAIFSGGFHCIDIQFTNTNELVGGYVHHLAFGTYSTLQIVVGICQVFISKAADANLPFTSVCGGIPALVLTGNGECGAELKSAATDRFWSCSMEASGSIGDWQNLRKSLYCNRNYSVYFEGMVHVNINVPEDIFDLPLRLVAFTPTDNVDDYFGTTAQVLLYGSDLPLYIDAFLAFGPKMIGQVWDAYIATKDYPLETINVSVENTDVLTTWRSFNLGFTSGYALRRTGEGTYFGTLFLVIEFPDYPASGSGGNSNYAY